MFLDKSGLPTHSLFCSAGFSSNLKSKPPDSVPVDWAATRCLWRAGYVFAGLGGWVLEETVKSRMRHRDEHTRCFRLCCEGCLALGDGDTVEMRQFCMYRCLGSALCSSGTVLGKGGRLHGRGGGSLAYFWKNSTRVHHRLSSAGGSGGGCVAPPED